MNVNYKTGKFVSKISVESRFVNDEGKIGAVCTDRLRAQDLEEITKLMS